MSRSSDLTIWTRAWGVLSPPRTGDLASFPIDIYFGSAPCRAAVDRNGVRHFLVPAEPTVEAPAENGAALQTKLRALTFDNATGRYLDLSCHDGDLNFEFDDLLTEIIDELHAGDEKKPAAKALEVVARWRRLFQAARLRGLKRSERWGLCAELTVLRELLILSGSATSSWRGPRLEPHDFEMLRASIEVKAIGSGVDRVVIHGARQLDPKEGKGLHLLVLTVIDDPEGRTINELVHEVRALTTESSVLEELLELAELPAPVGSASDTERLSVVEVLHVEVDENVPKVVPSSFVDGVVPVGVQNVVYELRYLDLVAHGRLTQLGDVVKALI